MSKSRFSPDCGYAALCLRPCVAFMKFHYVNGNMSKHECSKYEKSLLTSALQRGRYEIFCRGVFFFSLIWKSAGGDLEICIIQHDRLLLESTSGFSFTACSPYGLCF